MHIMPNIYVVAAKTALINVEFSYGRWNGDDAKALEEPLQHTVARICSYSICLEAVDHFISL